MAEIRLFVKGEGLALHLPDAMSAPYRALAVRSSMSGVNARDVAALKKYDPSLAVRNPAAYLVRSLRHIAAQWGTEMWAKEAARLKHHQHVRSTLPTVLDAAGALWAMWQAGNAGRDQLAAILGHEPCEGAPCRVCDAIRAGDWPTLRRETGLDAMTVEIAYRWLEAGAAVGKPRRPFQGTPRRERVYDRDAF